MLLILLNFIGLCEMKLKGSCNSNKRIEVIDIFLPWFFPCWVFPSSLTCNLLSMSCAPFYIHKLTKYFLISELINFLKDNTITNFFVCFLYVSLKWPSFILFKVSTILMLNQLFIACWFTQFRFRCLCQLTCSSVAQIRFQMSGLIFNFWLNFWLRNTVPDQLWVNDHTFCGTFPIHKDVYVFLSYSSIVKISTNISCKIIDIALWKLNKYPNSSPVKYEWIL